MSRLLLVLSIAFLGGGRISLLDGITPFMMTPFLALTVPVVVSEFLSPGGVTRLRRDGVPRPAVAYACVCVLLLSVVSASVLASAEASTSAARVALLAVEIGATLVIAIALSTRDDAMRILVRGATVGLVLFIVFDILDMAWVLGRVPEDVAFGPIAINFTTDQYAGLIPRLAGTVGDPNPAGLLLVFYGYVFATGVRRTRVRRLLIGIIGILLLLTLSRSGLLAAFTTTVALIVIRGRPYRVPLSVVRGGMLLAAGLSVLLVTSRSWLAAVGSVLEPLTLRFSLGEGSTQDHFALISRGLSEGTASVSRLAMGIGYGSGYTVLQDFFPGNRYGNFHSLYVTMLAETGLLGLLLVLALLVVAIVRTNPYRPFVLGAMAFGLFYNVGSEPLFWLTLALAWSHVHFARPDAAPRLLHG